MPVAKRDVVVLGGGKEQIRQFLLAQDVEDEDATTTVNRSARCRVFAQTLPAFALRVEEDLLVGRHLYLGT